MIHQKIVNVILIFVLTCLVKITIPNFSMLNAIGALDSVLTSDTFSHKDVNTMISHVTMNLSFISSASERNPTMINTSNSTGKASEKLNVVTSVSPIANIIKNIGGNRIELEGLVPEGINSHTFELVPSDVIKINNADLVIIDGLGLETNIEEIAIAKETQNKDPKLQVLKLGDNTITPDQWVFDFSFPEKQGDPNPHLWLNVVYAMKFANLTRDKLIEMDPQNAQYYSANTDRYIALLKKLDERILEAVQTVPPQNRKLLTYHDSWAYFAPRYNMTVIGAVQPSDFGEPTTLEVARIIDQIRSEKVPAIFASEVFPTQIMHQIAKEGNVKIVGTLSDDELPGNPGEPEHSYAGMMLKNVKNMLIPLGGNVTSLQGFDPSDTYLDN